MDRRINGEDYRIDSSIINTDLVYGKGIQETDNQSIGTMGQPSGKKTNLGPYVILY